MYGFLVALGNQYLGAEPYGVCAIYDRVSQGFAFAIFAWSLDDVIRNEPKIAYFRRSFADFLMVIMAVKAPVRAPTFCIIGR